MDHKPFTKSSINEYIKVLKPIEHFELIDKEQIKTMGYRTKSLFNFPKTPNAHEQARKYMIVSPSMNSKFSPCVNIRESPFLKGRQKPWLNKSKSFMDASKTEKIDENSKKINQLLKINEIAKDKKEKQINLLNAFRKTSKRDLKKVVISEKTEFFYDKNKAMSLNPESSDENNSEDEKKNPNKTNSMSHMNIDKGLEKVNQQKTKKHHSDNSDKGDDSGEGNSSGGKSTIKKTTRNDLKMLLSNIEPEQSVVDSPYKRFREKFKENDIIPAFKQSLNGELGKTQNYTKK